MQLAGVKHSLREEDITELARLAHGFVGADLCLFVKEACFSALRRCLKSKLTDLDDMWVRRLSIYQHKLYADQDAFERMEAFPADMHGNIFIRYIRHCSKMRWQPGFIDPRNACM